MKCDALFCVYFVELEEGSPFDRKPFLMQLHR